MSNVTDPIIVIFDKLTDEDASVCRATLGFLKVDEAGNVNAYADDAFESSVHSATGSSKRTQVDRVDKSLGEQLAVGRALKKLADDILADAQKQIDRHDREREARKAKKAKRAKTETLDEAEIATITKSVGERRVTKYINGQLVKVIQSYI